MIRHLKVSVLFYFVALIHPTMAGGDDTDSFPLGALGGRALQTPGSSLLRVTEVPAGSPAAAANLQVGDRIYAVNGKNLPITEISINDGWRGAVSELGYAIERSETTTGALTLGIFRPLTGAITINAILPLTTPWRPSYPTGDPRSNSLFDKTCADLHSKIQSSTTGDFAYNTGWFGMTLLASQNWNATTGPTPYRNSIDKIRNRCILYLNGRVLEPVEPGVAGFVDAGLENWDIVSSCMFIGEYRRKTGDISVNADVQRCAVLLANRIQHYTQADTQGRVYNKFGIMGHGGVDGDYAHLWLTGLNIINAHTMVAMGILKGAGADFTAIAGSSALTLDQKFLMNWSWLKKCTLIDNGSDDGCVGYQGVESGWDAAGRTAGSAAGYQIYLNAGGTAATADDLDKLARQKAYVARHWQRQQHAHAYTAGGVALSQTLMPFLSDRSQRYFMENSRFLYTFLRDHSGSIQYMPGRGNNGGDEYLSFGNVKYYLSGLAQAMQTGNLPSFPAPSVNRAFVRMNSPINDWPQLAARRVKVANLVQNLDLDITDNLGNPLAGNYLANWSQVSGALVGFSTTTAADTTVTFPAAGNYRLRLSASVGANLMTEDYDFEVVTIVSPPVANLISKHPVSRAGVLGGRVSFSVATTGTGPYLYQWRLNGVAYSVFPSNPVLNLTNLSAGHAGIIDCVIYTPTGNLMSDPATLSIATTSTVTGGGLKREVWNSLSGTSIASLTSNQNYPLFPDVSSLVTMAETPSAQGDNYGQKLSGWLLPPITGQYKFYLTSDDASELWLSTTDSSNNRVKIAQVTSYTSYRGYSSGGKSAFISLTAGQRYYIEILHKEGSGGDHLSVAWQLPAGAVPADNSLPIGGAYLEYNNTTGAPTVNGLVSWWKMDDVAGDTAIDSLAAGNDGELSSPMWVPGKYLGALYFDGNDRVTCSNYGALSGAIPFSVSAWVKVDNGYSAEAVVVQQRDIEGYNGQYQLKVTAAGKIGFYVYGNGFEQFNFVGNTSINDGQWHHIAGVRDASGNGYVYLDGVQNGSVSGTTVRSLDGTIRIGIGCDIRGSEKYFRGSIDDVRIYNRGLSAAQVYSLATAGSTAPYFLVNPINQPAITLGTPILGTLAATAADLQNSPLTFSKISGPSWLSVGANGSLTGTPVVGDAGLNLFSIGVSNSGGLSAVATLSIQVDVVNPDTNSNGILDVWETQKFGNANPGSNISSADPDGDGISNLLEFAFDTHPGQFNVSPLTYDMESLGFAKHLRLSVPKNPAATNLSFTVEVCGDLKSGSWTAAQTVIEINTSTLLRVRDTENTTTEDRRFMRLKVRSNP